LIIWIGIFVCSRISAAFALIGSILGVMVAFGLGANVNDIEFGLWGYNGYLLLFLENIPLIYLPFNM
jgi:urea transporter